MDKKNQPHRSDRTKFLTALFSLEPQPKLPGFGLPVPAILLSHAQQFMRRPDAVEWSWYVGKGYQLWDSIRAKNIFVLARDENEALYKFMLEAPCDIDCVNELPNGNCEDYDLCGIDGESCENPEFEYHSPFRPSPFDFVEEIERDLIGG